MFERCLRRMKWWRSDGRGVRVLEFGKWVGEVTGGFCLSFRRLHKRLWMSQEEGGAKL